MGVREVNQADKQSTFFFPLRSNVEFFRTKETYVDLSTRVKLVSLLYDRIVFQWGIYWCSLGPEGSMDGVRPPGSTDQDVEMTDNHDSDHFWVRIRASDAGPDVPFTTILESPLERYYKSNFHPLYGELVNAGFENVEIAPITMLAKAKSESRKLSRKVLKKVDQDRENLFLYKKIFENLYLDLILISDLAWPASVDQLHSEYIKEIARGNFITSTPPGILSMGLSFPNIGSVPWDEISDLRNEPSVLSLRRKLMELERSVRDMLGESSTEEISREVSRSLIHELIDEVFEGQSTIARELSDYARNLSFDVVGSFLPPATVVGIGIDAAKTMKKVAEIDAFSRSWIAGYFHLKSLTSTDE